MKNTIIITGHVVGAIILIPVMVTAVTGKILFNGLKGIGKLFISFDSNGDRNAISTVSPAIENNG